MDDEKPIKGYRANCIFINEFEVELDQKLFEEVMAGFVKTDPRPFSEEVKIISTPKEFEVKNDT